MKQFVLFLLCLVFLHGVRAVPLDERQALDPLEDFVTSLFEIEATPTPTDREDGQSTPTPRPDSEDEDDEDEDEEDEEETSRTLPGPTVRTTSSETSSSEPTSASTSTSTSRSSTTSSSTSSTSSPTPTQTAPTNPLTADSTPSPSKKSSSSISPAGIAVAIIMSIAILIAIFIVVWKFHPRVVAWRKQKAYERMKERSYRPALDGPYSQSSSISSREKLKGLGLEDVELSPTNTRPLSFFAFASPRKSFGGYTIKRKPVPTASPGGGVNSLAAFPIAEIPKLEKDLPPRPG